MSDALSKKLDEIEAWAHEELNDCNDADCGACHYTRAVLALVAAVRAGHQVNAYIDELVQTELCEGDIGDEWIVSDQAIEMLREHKERSIASLHAIEELKL